MDEQDKIDEGKTHKVMDEAMDKENMVSEEAGGKPELLGDSTRFVEYSFGSVQTGSLQVQGELLLSGVAMGNPLDGATVKIPSNVTTVIIQNIYPYTQLTFTLPLQPGYGKILSIVSTVDVQNVQFANATFGTVKPTEMKASIPLRFIFAGSWFNA